MDLETFRQYCLGKLAATESTPFGEDVLVFKVAGKIFALAALDEVPATANLKCDPDLALELRDRYEQVRPVGIGDWRRPITRCFAERDEVARASGLRVSSVRKRDACATSLKQFPLVPLSANF